MDGMTINHIVSIDHGSYVSPILLFHLKLLVKDPSMLHRRS